MWWEQQFGGKNKVIKNCGTKREQIAGHIFLPISIPFYLPYLPNDVNRSSQPSYTKAK
jgi:hypothetical protein